MEVVGAREWVVSHPGYVLPEGNMIVYMTTENQRFGQTHLAKQRRTTMSRLASS